MKELSIRLLQQMNAERSESENGFNCPVDNWSEAEWMNALVGEVGEAANLIKKKYHRGEEIDKRAIADELADAMCYLTLLAEKMEIDLEEATIRKFNEVSERIGSSIYIR